MKSKAQKKAQAKYSKEKCKQFNLVFYPTDADIVKHLDGMQSKTAYIKELIRKDMQK